MTLSHQVCWQSFCLTELPEGRYELFHASSNDVHAWFYRPGQQLLVEVEGQQWREASIVEMQADGAYCVRVYYDTTQQVDAIEVRLTEKNHVVSACYRHPKGSGLCLFHRAGGWRDVVVRETIDGSNWHRVTFSIRPGDETTEEAVVLLNPFNHSLRLLPSRDYDDAMRKYRAFVMSRYGFIADALTGERLSIEDQIIKLELSDANTARGGTSGQDQLLAMTNPVVNRNSGFRDVSRVLVEAEAAGGKSVMMRQCLHACCKWDHRDKNDTVPILVLIIDLQRSMAKFADEYHEAEDLVGVYLRLNHPDGRCDALMQVSIPNARCSLIV